MMILALSTFILLKNKKVYSIIGYPPWKYEFFALYSGTLQTSLSTVGIQILDLSCWSDQAMISLQGMADEIFF